MRFFITFVFALFIAMPLKAGDINAFKRGSLAKIVAQHSGTPFIVSYWSIDCPPCFKELKMWASLSQKFATLSIILVSTDGMEKQDLVAATLAELGVTELESWVFAESMVERLRFDIDPHWYGELPRTYFYSKRGEKYGVSGLIQAQQVLTWMQDNS
ncbi:MAG TPA: TlpA family protein disulfide reductase [Gammaproteobacteria bacterium]|nr:TlpA family protein disulfide reductase [Gammaproteobacteria bacterium]